MTVRFKDISNSVDTVSIESELSQLETIIAALECAQVNPELATLMYGPEVSVESFGAKVKDTAKKIWEAIVAFFKKLFGSSKKTEQRANDVKKEADEANRTKDDIVVENPDIEAEIAQFDKLVSKIKAYSDLPADLEQWVGNDYKKLPIRKCVDVFVKYLKYKGHVLAGSAEYSGWGIYEVAYHHLIKDFNITKTEEWIKSFITDVVAGIKIHFDAVHESFGLDEVLRLRTKYPNKPRAFELELDVLDHRFFVNDEFALTSSKGTLENINKRLDTISKLQDDYFPEHRREVYVKLLSNLSKICHLYLDLHIKCVEYYEAVIALRESMKSLVDRKS